MQYKANALDAERALRASEESFGLLVEGVQDYAIYFLDPAGIITSWNSGAAKINGYTKEEIVGKHFSCFHTEEDVARGVPNAILRTAVEMGHYTGEGWRVRKDGSRFWSSITVTPIYHAGELLGFSKITRDMTERKAFLDKIQQHAEELEQAKRGLQMLSAQLLQAEDAERRRLARELHDGVSQTVVALSLNLHALQGRIESVLEGAVSPKLQEAIELADQALKEIRTVSYLLHPPLLDESGLTGALEWLTHGFSERTGIKVSLHLDDALARFSSDLETAIFRIVQECLTNIHRHSRSPTAVIRLAMESEWAILTVADEGQGVPAEMLNQGARLSVGLRGMRERVLHLGGRFEVARGNPGTIIRAMFPYTQRSTTGCSH